jgi:hypothetical protein
MAHANITYCNFLVFELLQKYDFDFFISCLLAKVKIYIQKKNTRSFGIIYMVETYASAYHRV